MEPIKIHPALEMFWRENCCGCKNLKCSNTPKEIILNREQNERFCLERK